jgi:hypothetical protein
MIECPNGRLACDSSRRSLRIVAASSRLSTGGTLWVRFVVSSGSDIRSRSFLASTAGRMAGNRRALK